MKSNYRVVIVGAGPAGIGAALELAKAGVQDLLLLDRGVDLGKRKCPLRERGGSCRKCAVCHLLAGWGGAGAYSDGKLTLSARVGGFLNEYLPASELDALIAYVDRIFLDHGAPEKRYGDDAETADAISRQAREAGLVFTPSAVRHMGSDGAREAMAAVRRTLDAAGVEVRFGARVAQVVSEGQMVAGVLTSAGRLIRARHVVLAPGRSGHGWLAAEGKRLGLKAVNNPVDIGVRVELAHDLLAALTEKVYELKLSLDAPSFHDPVRTFCMCPDGEVVCEHFDGVNTVNGQSYAGRRTGRTNFAILVSTRFTEPFNDPVTYGRSVAGLANLLSGGILVQRFGDLRAGRRSTHERIAGSRVQPSLASAVPGDLSFALPYRHLTGIREMLTAMDLMAPGVGSADTLLYGVETKFYSLRMEVTSEMETSVRNLYAVGDGAGVSRSLMQAAVSGVIAARSIRDRLMGAR